MSQLLLRNCPLAKAITISLQAVVDEAEQLLLQHVASDLYVIDTKNHVLGVVPDYVFLKRRWLGSHSQNLVSEIMSPISVSLSINDSIDQAVTLLKENIHSKIPVIDQQQIVGTLDRVSIIKFLYHHEDAPDQELHQGNLTVSIPKFLRFGEMCRKES